MGALDESASNTTGAVNKSASNTRGAVNETDSNTTGLLALLVTGLEDSAIFLLELPEVVLKHSSM